MTVRAPSPDGVNPRREARLARIRQRLTATKDHDLQLRAMLVLAHEVLRARADDGGATPAASATAPAPAAAGRAPVTDYAALVARVHEIVTDSVPARARVSVISRGDDKLFTPGFDSAHFPQGPDRGYAGYHPRDSAGAIAHLEEHRSAGAEFLVLPATGYWWLDYYGEFALHLLTDARVVRHNEHCLIFDLRAKPQGALLP
jgi:hypothetical protein